MAVWEIPVSVYSDEYYENLRLFRDEALRESKLYGSRIKLGKLSLGTAVAQWQSSDGGLAYLRDEGIRLGKMAIGHPTTMLLVKSQPSGHELTKFKMDIDFVETIDVYRHITETLNWREFFRVEFPVRADKRYQLNEPTDEDLALLYSELQRGASGCYPPHDAVEDIE